MTVCTAPILLLCPFCGDKPETEPSYIRDGAEVLCRCGASMRFFNPNSSQKAMNAWNRRIDLPGRLLLDKMYAALNHASHFISGFPHGENCYLFSDSAYPTDRGGCYCGREGAERFIDDAISAYECAPDKEESKEPMTTNTPMSDEERREAHIKEVLEVAEHLQVDNGKLTATEQYDLGEQLYIATNAFDHKTMHPTHTQGDVQLLIEVARLMFSELRKMHHCLDYMSEQPSYMGMPLSTHLGGMAHLIGTVVSKFTTTEER